MSSERVDAALASLRTEYLETPTLLLTVGEAAELLDLTRTAALAVLQALENSGFLALTPDGRFGRPPDRRREDPGASSTVKGPERLHPVCQEELYNPGLVCPLIKIKTLF